MPDVLLGSDPKSGKPFALDIERHLLTIAGSGAGKGQAQIIPNLFAWPHSAVVIDPAGEAAEATALHRAEQLGQEVAILDPFGYCRGEHIEPFLKGLNILDLVNSSGDLFMIADGIVKRAPGESQPHWNDSATEVIAGFLAYILEAPSLEDAERQLGSLRDVLTLMRAKDQATLEEMSACEAFTGLAAATAARLGQGSDETASVLSTVQTQTRWLSFDEMAAWLRLPSSVDLRALKSGRMTVYLVIPPDKLRAQGQFLRLFVRAAIGVMQERAADGAYRGTPCLMILDEFYSLGRMSEMQEAAAQMRKFGLHLWPFLQDWGQLVELYGAPGAQGFFTNADAVSVFGVTDPVTLQQVSQWFGHVSPAEIEQEALELANRIEGSETWRRFGLLTGGRGEYVQNQSLAIAMTLLQRRIGQPRKSPTEIQYQVGKGFDDELAREMYVFLRDGEIRRLKPRRHSR